MDKQNAVYPYNRYDEVLIHDTTCMDEPGKDVKWKISSRKTTYYIIPFIWNVQNRLCLYRQKED